MAVVGRGPRGLLGSGVGVLRGQLPDAPRGGTGRAGDPRSAVVRGRAAQLCRGAARACRDARGVDRPRRRGRGRSGADDRAAARPGRSAGRNAAPARGRSGDRVAAYLPNVPEAIVGMLATASLGAVWSVCAPDFASSSVIDRFSQIEPTVLIAVDGYRFNGRRHDRSETISELQAGLPSLRATIVSRRLDPDRALPDIPGVVDFSQACAPAREPEFATLEFAHPLWILFSSGTTGLPKGIVQSHGGILAGAPEVAGAVHGPGAGRPLPVLQLHELDGVELPGRWSAARHDGRAL